jgi:hypothetical protein
MGSPFIGHSDPVRRSGVFALTICLEIPILEANDLGGYRVGARWFENRLRRFGYGAFIFLTLLSAANLQLVKTSNYFCRLMRRFTTPNFLGTHFRGSKLANVQDALAQSPMRTQDVPLGQRDRGSR